MTWVKTWKEKHEESSLDIDWRHRHEQSEATETIENLFSDVVSYARALVVLTFYSVTFSYQSLLIESLQSNIQSLEKEKRLDFMPNYRLHVKRNNQLNNNDNVNNNNNNSFTNERKKQNKQHNDESTNE